MTLNEVNAELQILANEEIEERIESEYQEFMNEMYALWELEQYERDCSDLDAIYYGEM